MRQLPWVRLAVLFGLASITLSALQAVPTAADKSFALAVQYTKLGNDQKATEELQRFVTSYPDDERVPQVGYLLGSIWQNQQAYAKALTQYAQVLSKAIGLNYTALRADTHYQMGECYRMSNSPDKAIQSYENCLQLNSKVPADDKSVKFISDRVDLTVRAQYWLAESYYQCNRESEAQRAYEAVLAKAPTHDYAPWACYSLGIIALHQSRNADAIARFEQLATDYPKFSGMESSRLYLGLAYAEQARRATTADARDTAMNKALEVWNTLLGATASTDIKQQTTMAMAKAYVGLGDTDHAVTAYGDTLALLDPASQAAVETQLQLGHLLYNAKRFADASKAYAKVSQVKKYPELATSGLFWLGNSAYQQALAGKDIQAYHDAVNALTSFLTPPGDKDENAASAALIVAYCYEDLASAGEKDAREKAISAYSRVLKQWAKSDQATQARVGIMRMTQSMSPDQLRTLTVALPTGATSWDVNLQLAKKEFDAGNYDNAITAARQVLDGKPAADLVAQSAYLIGISLSKQGRASESVNYFKQVVTSTPNGELLPYARRALVQAYLDMHSYTEACSAAAALLALSLQGNDEVARNNEQAERLAYLAAAYLGNQQQDEALATYRKIVTQFPESTLAANSMMNMAAIAEARNDLKTAIATYQEFITKYPDDEHVPDAFFQLGVDLAKQQDYAKAIDAFNNVPATSKYADQAAYAIAWTYVDQKMIDKANAQFQLLIDKFPGSALASDCWFHLGQARFEQKDYAEAMRYFSRALDLCKDDAQGAVIAYQLGVSAYSAKDYIIAANAFGKIVANYPNSEYATDSAFWRASSLENQGVAQAAAARDAYQQYLSKYPDKNYAADAALGIGRAEVSAKLYPAARTDLQKALDLYNKLEAGENKDLATRAKGLEVEAQYLVAQSYFEEKDYAQALREFAVLSMFQYDPWCTRARLQVARCYANQGDKGSAKKILQDLIATSPNSDAAKQAPDVAKELGVQL